MNNTEIKKLYTKTKKAFEKRTGDKHTWVMNAKQQCLGTATVLVGYSYDIAEKLVKTKAYYSAENVQARAEHSWKFYVDHAAEEEATGGGSWNPTYWRDILAREGSQEEMVAKAMRAAEKAIADVQIELDKKGSFANQVKNAHEYAESFISSQEVQTFLKAIGGQAVIEDKNEGGAILTYVRFHYSATAA